MACGDRHVEGGGGAGTEDGGDACVFPDLEVGGGVDVVGGVDAVEAADLGGEGHLGGVGRVLGDAEDISGAVWVGAHDGFVGVGDSVAVVVCGGCGCGEEDIGDGAGFGAIDAEGHEAELDRVGGGRDGVGEEEVVIEGEVGDFVLGIEFVAGAIGVVFVFCDEGGYGVVDAGDDIECGGAVVAVDVAVFGAVEAVGEDGGGAGAVAFIPLVDEVDDLLGGEACVDDEFGAEAVDVFEVGACAGVRGVEFGGEVDGTDGGEVDDFGGDDGFDAGASVDGGGSGEEVVIPRRVAGGGLDGGGGAEVGLADDEFDRAVDEEGLGGFRVADVCDGDAEGGDACRDGEADRGGAVGFAGGGGAADREARAAVGAVDDGVEGDGAVVVQGDVVGSGGGEGWCWRESDGEGWGEDGRVGLVAQGEGFGAAGDWVGAEGDGWGRVGAGERGALGGGPCGAREVDWEDGEWGGEAVVERGVGAVVDEDGWSCAGDGDGGAWDGEFEVADDEGFVGGVAVADDADLDLGSGGWDDAGEEEFLIGVDEGGSGEFGAFCGVGAAEAAIAVDVAGSEGADGDPVDDEVEGEAVRGFEA